MCHRWGSIFKKPSVNPQRVNCGHMTSPKVTIHFWLITFDKSVIQASTQYHWVSLVITDRMIAILSIWVRSWPWPEVKLYLTFLGDIIHHSTRLEKLNTMVVKSLTYIFGVQSYDRQIKSSKIRPLWPFMTSAGQTVDMRSNLRAYHGKICKRAIECVFFAPS